MKYEIKIENALEQNGQIELKRLALISESILQVAAGSIQIRLNGISFTRGRMPDFVEKALSIQLTGMAKGSTILKLECNTFEETLNNVQLNVFKQKETEDLLQKTPVSLFIQSFNEALDESLNKDMLDKPLLNKLKGFKKAFYSTEEKIVFTNQKNTKQLILSKNLFKKINIIEEETPDPKKIILNGIVEVLEYSKKRVKIITKEGPVEAYLSDRLVPEQIKEFWGHNVTIVGIAHYRYGGRLGIVEIEKIFEPKEGDKYFSRKTNEETSEQQINKQLKEKEFKNNLNDIIGKLDVEEDFDELLSMLSK